MLQDTGMRRPRETLGGINHNTSIPQPSSALKRSSSISGVNNAPYTVGHTRAISGSRASLAPPRPNQPPFPRPSPGANVADLSMPLVKQNNLHNNNGRKSYAPVATGRPSGEIAERRGSILGRRRSTNGPIGHQNFFQQPPQPAGVPRDPRPLKDRAYQTKIGQELLEYMTCHNFEMEMKHALSQNTVKSPTQKDFNYMFQWFYHRIDPSYRFLKNIDQEVPVILKQLRYPFEKSITKSQIAAVGGQNWSTFLGLLHWMMQLAQILDGYATNQYDDACAKAGIDVSSDRISFDFLTSAYRDWLQVEDNADVDQDEVLKPHFNAMAQAFEVSISKYHDELKILDAENERLHTEIEEVEKSTPDIARLDSFFKTMEEDRLKFEGYDEKMVQKCERYEARIQLLQEEIEKATAELKDAEEERARLQKSVDEQGISMQDIDRLTSERERLQKGIESTQQRLDEAKKRAAEKETEASRKLDELERIIDKYNSLGYQIGLIPSTLPNAKGKDFELHVILNEGPNFSSSQIKHSQQISGSVDGDRLLSDPVTGYQPHQILNLDLRGQVKGAFLSFRKEVSERRSTAMEMMMKNHDLLDGIKEAIEDKRSEVDALEHRVRAAQEEFEKTKEITTTQKIASDTQIEKMEKELARMRADLTESGQLMEQREMNTNIQYEQLTMRANALREELHTEVERILNDIIKFKVHIQKNLEDYESFVVEEAERELEGRDDPKVENMNEE